MKIKIIAMAFLLCLVGVSVYSLNKDDTFAPAKNIPGDGVLIYLQTNDLPKLVDTIKESVAFNGYLRSDGFDAFKNRHLGRKLISRFNEFSDALNTKFSINFLSSVAQDKAAMAVYDIGKLEFIYIAPFIGDESAIKAAAIFTSSMTSEFTEDGFEIFRVKVEADRGRQFQEIFVAAYRSHLITATSEVLMRKSLRLLSGKTETESLANRRSFSTLTRSVVPTFAVVWIDQQALNDDYYFNRYQLNVDKEALKNFESAMFEISINDENISEKRQFLLKTTSRNGNIDQKDLLKLESYIPKDIQFYSIKPAKVEELNSISKLITNKSSGEKRENEQNDHFGNTYISDDDIGKKINEENHDKNVRKKEVAIDIASAFLESKPYAIIAINDVSAQDLPIFIRSKKAYIVGFRSQDLFDQNRFESELIKIIADKMLAGAGLDLLKWKSDGEVRELIMSKSGFEYSYVFKDDLLVIANDRLLLNKLIENTPEIQKHREDLASLLVIDVKSSTAVFDEIFAKKWTADQTSDFFTVDIGSLVNASKSIDRFEISEKNNGNIIEQTLTGTFEITK